MERRCSERKTVKMETVFTSGNKRYRGVIGNVSEYGAYLKTNLTNTAIDFLPKTTVELTINILSGKTILVPCEIIWLYTKQISTRHSATNEVLDNDIGMEIQNPPLEYKDFLETL